MIPLNFSAGDRIPTPTVLGKIQTWKLGPGIFPVHYYFLRVRGTSYIIGVQEDVAKQLIAEKDQAKLRKMMRPLLAAEVMAARSGRPSPGKMLLIEQKGDAMRQVTELRGGGGKEKKGQEKKALAPMDGVAWQQTLGGALEGGTFGAIPGAISGATGGGLSAVRDAHRGEEISLSEFLRRSSRGAMRGAGAGALAGGLSGGASSFINQQQHLRGLINPSWSDARDRVGGAGLALSPFLGLGAGYLQPRAEAPAVPHTTGRPIPQPGSPEYGGPDTPVHAMKAAAAPAGSVSAALSGGGGKSVSKGQSALRGSLRNVLSRDARHAQTTLKELMEGAAARVAQPTGRVQVKQGVAPAAVKPVGSISAHLPTAGKPPSMTQGGATLHLRDRMRTQHIGQSARQNAVLSSGADGDVWTQKAGSVGSAMFGGALGAGAGAAAGRASSSDPEQKKRRTIGGAIAGGTAGAVLGQHAGKVLGNRRAAAEAAQALENHRIWPQKGRSKNAAAVPPTGKEASVAMQALGRAGAGAAVGAAGGALAAGPEKRKQGALRGAALGGAVGAATTLPGVLRRSMGAAPAAAGAAAPRQLTMNAASQGKKRVLGNAASPARPPIPLGGPKARAGINPAEWDIPRHVPRARTGDMSQMLDDMALRKGASLGGVAGAIGGAQGGSQHGLLSSGIGSLVGHLVGDYVLPVVEEALLHAGPDFHPLAKPAALLASGVAGEISGRVIGGILQPHPQETEMSP